MNKQEMVDQLIEDAIQGNGEYVPDGLATYLEQILREGFQGYNHMSEQQLEEELAGRGLLDDLAETED